MQTKTRIFLHLSLFLTFLLTACQSQIAGGEPTPFLDISAPSLQASSPTPPSQIVLLMAVQSPSPLSAEIESALITYAQSHSFDFQSIDSLNALSFSAPLSALIAIGDFTDLDQLALDHPESKVISISPQYLSGPPNLFSLNENKRAAEIAAFLLGYSAAFSTNDWRVGALYLQDEILYANAFLAGAEYFCGACAPVAPPYNNYPQAFSLSDAGNWLPQAQEMLNQGIRTIYLSPTLEIPEIQQFFADRSIKLLGSIDPGDSVSNQWLLSIAPNSSSQIVHQLLALLNGLPVEGSQSSLIFSNINSNEISEARLIHIQDLLAEIELGFIAMPSEIIP